MPLVNCNPKQILNVGQPSRSKNKRAKSYQITIAQQKCGICLKTVQVIRALTKRQASDQARDKVEKLTNATGFVHTVFDLREVQCKNCI